MAKKPKLDEFTTGRMRQAYLANLSLNKTALRKEISKRFHCSIPTVIRYAKEGGWEELRQAAIASGHKEDQTPTQAATVSTPSRYGIVVNGEAIDVEALLVQGIEALFAQGLASPVKSQEAALAVAVKLVQEYRRYHPLTMDDLIDAALTMPGFNPVAFARRLKERIEQSS